MSWHAGCPPPEELTRELTTGAGTELERHLAECEGCRTEWQSFEQVIELGRELPEGLPEAERVEQVRGAVLAAAADVRPRGAGSRWLWIGGAAAAVVALTLVGWSLLGGADEEGRPGAEPVTRATVHPHGDAEYLLAGAQPDEIVRLTAGTITVEVERLGPGERFRVVVGNAEVEVHGTVFDVSATDDRLEAVAVISGEVEVRPTAQEAELLSAGRQWRRPAEPAGTLTEAATVGSADEERPAIESAAEERPTARGAAQQPVEGPVPSEDEPGASAAPPLQASPAELAFEEGWTTLRSGNPRGAAAAIVRARALGGGEAIVEDASFWRAVAHTRSGQTRAASRALHSFLQRYPRSSRAGEALTMLGWQLYDAGEIDAAEGHFRKALADPVAKVRASARRGLEAVHARRRGTD